jgi:hypothetical protein
MAVAGTENTESKKTHLITIWQIGLMNDYPVKEILARNQTETAEDYVRQEAKLSVYRIRGQPEYSTPWFLKRSDFIILFVGPLIESRFKSLSLVQYISEHVSKDRLIIRVYNNDGTRDEDWELRIEQHASEVYERKRLNELRTSEKTEKNGQRTFGLLEDSARKFGFSIGDFIVYCSTPKSVANLEERFDTPRVLVKYICERLVQAGSLNTIGRRWEELQVYNPLKFKLEFPQEIELLQKAESERAKQQNKGDRKTAEMHRLVLLGNRAVGKRMVYLHFADEINETDLTHTLFSALAVKDIDTGTSRHRFVIFINAYGNSSNPSLEGLCRNASGAIFVFDTTNPGTLETMDDWMSLLQAPVLMVENKTDLESRTPRSLIDSYREKYKAQFSQTGFGLSDSSKKEEFEHALLRLVEKPTRHS